MTVRIAGVNLPLHKHVVIGLTAIFGVGGSTARKLCQQEAIEPHKKIQELTADEVGALRNALSAFRVEGDLRSEIRRNIKREMDDLKSYRGHRHRRGLPVHGQRTKTNARTRKGKRRPAVSRAKVKGK